MGAKDQRGINGAPTQGGKDATTVENKVIKAGTALKRTGAAVHQPRVRRNQEAKLEPYAKKHARNINVTGI